MQEIKWVTLCGRCLIYKMKLIKARFVNTVNTQKYKDDDRRDDTRDDEDKNKDTANDSRDG